MPKRSFDRKKNRKRADGVAEIGPVRSVPEHPTKPVNETIEIDKWLKLVERLLGERNTADLSVKYKAELEEILTLKVCKQQQGISSVSVSADGQFAIYNVANRSTGAGFRGDGGTHVACNGPVLHPYIQ